MAKVPGMRIVSLCPGRECASPKACDLLRPQPQEAAARGRVGNLTRAMLNNARGPGQLAALLLSGKRGSGASSGGDPRRGQGVELWR